MGFLTQDTLACALFDGHVCIYNMNTLALANNNKIFYENSAAFQEHFNNGDFCSTGSNKYGNICKLIKAAKAKCTQHFGTALIRGAGCNWMVCLAIWLQMIAT